MENYEKVNTILSRYPKNYKQSAIIPLLDLAQRQNSNFLSLAAMRKVSKICGTQPPAREAVACRHTRFAARARVADLALSNVPVPAVTHGSSSPPPSPHRRRGDGGVRGCHLLHHV